MTTLINKKTITLISNGTQKLQNIFKIIVKTSYSKLGITKIVQREKFIAKDINIYK